MYFVHRYTLAAKPPAAEETTTHGDKRAVFRESDRLQLCQVHAANFVRRPWILMNFDFKSFPRLPFMSFAVTRVAAASQEKGEELLHPSPHE